VFIDVSELTAGSYLITAFPKDEQLIGSFGRAIFIKQ